MLFYNAKILTPEGYVYGGFRVENGKFLSVFSEPDRDGGIDLNGAKVIPGLVDIHIHGCMGADFSDGIYEKLKVMTRYCARNGITSVVPASMSLPYKKLHEAFLTAKKLHFNRQENGARVMGIHMEGPYLSEERRGAQKKEYLKNPDYPEFESLYQDCGGLIRIVDVAPELPGAVSFIRQANNLCTVSVAHTDAAYEQAAEAFSAGARHITHLYNAMPLLHHRNPGVIGAAAERNDVFAELICDGFHVHPSAVRLAFRMFPDRICLISDSVRCCGMPDGVYELGEQEIIKENGAARLSNGTLAGAVSNLYENMKNAIRFGIPEKEAVYAASLRPAESIGMDSLIGSIEPGKLADFIVCSEELDLMEVYIGGISVS